MSDHAPRRSKMIEVASSVDLRLVKEPDEIAGSDSPKGKSFILITFPDGSRQAITTNIAEMIGGAGKGLRELREIDSNPLTPPGQAESVDDYPPVTGSSTSCPKCAVPFETTLHRFCQHGICPARNPQ